MKNAINEIFEGNWDELQGKVKQYWGKLTDQDIAKIEGSYKEFVGKLKKAYGHTEAQIEEEIAEFLHSEGLDGIKNKAKQVISNAYDYAERVKDNLQSSAENIRQKTNDVQDSVITYTQKNPLKSIGIALFTGVMLGKLLKSI